ncbi:Centrosomal protein like [Senna tora]|uniref:Centrosomal protein like n=1 Tax=Senna tora TaxID=362788 RepID=A0A834TTJ4_9FABA|nr:Centrosomal protein like [Senna tora]
MESVAGSTKTKSSNDVDEDFFAALTCRLIQLCTALETANQLVQSTNSNVALLSEKVGELQKIVKRGDSAIAAAKAVHVTPDDDKGASA